LKPPDHAIASGDRQMARALMLALSRGGHEVKLACRLQSFSAIPAPHVLAEARERARVAAEEMLVAWAESNWLPQAWFSYHSYYKAPDLIGPVVARRLDIPYFLAEASHAAKRSRDGWQIWQEAAEDGIRLAHRHFCFSLPDYQGLARFLASDANLVHFPPFIDLSGYPAVPPPRKSPQKIELVTVAMMRDGVKLDSYRYLAEVLTQLLDLDWRITLVGDGPQRAPVEQAFSALPRDRVRYAGILDSADVRRTLAQSDLYLWPGFGEAYGIAYLEAQACGLPVVALKSGGIESVVTDGQTGFLVEPQDIETFRAHIRQICVEPDLRHRLGLAAHAFIHRERGLDHASRRLNAYLSADDRAITRE
jgi:glycosyltransferase involved in cell wall biosynthesis